MVVMIGLRSRERAQHGLRGVRIGEGGILALHRQPASLIER